MKIFIPTTQKITSLIAADLFQRDMHSSNFGIPKGVVIRSRNPICFWIMKELYWILGIKGMASTRIHPQTDGQTEKESTKNWKTYLRFYVN